MKKRIFIYFIVLTIIGISITGFFISQLAQKYYKFEAQDKLVGMAKLIQNQIATDLRNGLSVDYNQYAAQYSHILSDNSSSKLDKNTTKIRLTFIDVSGKVVGESDTDFKYMENHVDRKEFQQALTGSVGNDIHYSKTLKTNFLYTAVLIPSANVVVRVSSPLLQLKTIDQTIWNYTIVGILAGILLTSILAAKFSVYVTQPIDQRFNDMNLELEKTVADLKDKNVKVDAIINSMGNGIIAVDNKFNVMLINAKACEIFGIKNGPGVIGINLIELVRNHKINHVLNETMRTNTSHTEELTLASPSEKMLKVYTSPIKSKDNISLNSGGVLIINDITSLKKLELIRTEFVSNVTHELKTPLTSIRGFIETLRNGAMEDSVVAKKFLDIIDIEAERLYILINDILQLSEIESRQQDSNIATHNLHSIVEETISILQGVADRKHVSLDWEVQEGLKIVANKDRIKQMLINLIDNSIKYNVENGSVNIRAFKADKMIVFSIKDTGIGIPDEHISRIFERFYRVDKGRSRNMGGTGLGLSIVKHIVNLYNGDIKVHSQPGKGTEFTIRLPV